MEVKEKVIDKIRKLLAKQESSENIGSLEEANAFALKIQDLLLKHNLSLFEISQKEGKDLNGVVREDHKEITNQKNEGLWIFDLYNVLCKYNYCRIIIIQRRQWEEGSGFIQVKYGSIIGSKDDIDVVLFLGDQLSSKIRYLAKSQWKIVEFQYRQKRGAFLRAFYQGAVVGLNHKLRQQQDLQKQTYSGVTALVLYKDQKVQDKINEEFHNLKNAANRKTNVGSIGGQMGFEAGRNLEINQGINSTSKTMIR